MDEELVEKIMHYKQGSDGEAATSDDNYFDDSSTITKTLSDEEGMDGDENSLILKLVSTGLLSVASENFSGCSVGEIEGAPPVVDGQHVLR